MTLFELALGVVFVPWAALTAIGLVALATEAITHRHKGRHRK